MSGKVKIRLLESGEVSTIIPLLQQRNPALTYEVLSERVSEMLSQNYRCAGAYLDGVLVGICGFWIKTRYHTGKLIEPDNVYVESNHQSSGIGQKLMEWIYEYGKNEGCLASELHCYVTNGDAHRFWFRQGYKIIAFHFGKEL